MKREALGPVLVFVWLAALVASYYVIHNPKVGGIALALGWALRDLAAVATLVTLGGALGMLILPALMPHSALERAALWALLGLGLISLLVLVTGLLGLFPPTWLAWAITLTGLAILWRQARDWMLDASVGLRVAFSGDGDCFGRVIRLGILILLGLAFLLALAPPTKWDALVYHMTGPALYLRAGRIVSAPENHFLGFPQLIEMLYLWLLILARPQAAAMLHWFFGVLMLGLLVGFAMQRFNLRVGWIAGAILLVSDSLWGEFHWAYNDLATMAYMLAAAVMLLEWGRGEAKNSLLLTGVFVGLAMGTKYTAASAAFGIGVLVLWLARRRGIKSVLIAGGTVSLSALVVFSPWLIKNWLLDGNPVSPFVVGTAAFDQFDQWYYLRPGTGLDPLSVLLAPLQGAIFGQEARAPYGASTGALLVAMLPLAAVGWRRREGGQRAAITHLLIFVLPSYLFWLSGVAISWFLVQTRLLFPIFPALALIGAWGLDGWWDSALLPNLGRLAELTVIAVLALAVLTSMISTVRANPLRVVLGLQAEESYLQGQLQAHYYAMQEIHKLPTGSLVLLLWEPRTYYCDGRCVPDSLINQWWHDRQLQTDPLQIASHWRNKGITHVLVFEAGMRFLVEEEPHEPLTAEDIAALNRLRAEALVLVWEGGDAYTLYVLRSDLP